MFVLLLNWISTHFTNILKDKRMTREPKRVLSSVIWHNLTNAIIPQLNKLLWFDHVCRINSAIEWSFETFLFQFYHWNQDFSVFDCYRNSNLSSIVKTFFLTDFRKKMECQFTRSGGKLNVVWTLLFILA